MRIALDGREADAPHGIGRVLRHLLRYLNESRLHHPAHNFIRLDRQPPAGAGIQPGPPIAQQALSRWDWLRLGSWLRRHGVDAFYSPYYKLPRGFAGRMVCTVHDLGFLTYPLAGYRRGRIYRMVARRRLTFSLRAATVIIAVSNFTRHEILAMRPEVADKIRVIPSGYDSSIFFPAAADRRALVARAIAGPYLLYVGNFSPHKRVALLLEAWDSPPGLAFVLVGAVDRYARELQQRFPKPGVVWAGTVGDDELANLYRGAAAFVYPSDYEGFGIPPVEALACGCPVVATRAAALPETLRDAALWVEPTPAGLRAGWQRLLVEPAIKNDLLARAAAFLPGYRHTVVGRAILEALTGGG